MISSEDSQKVGFYLQFKTGDPNSWIDIHYSEWEKFIVRWKIYYEEHGYTGQYRIVERFLEERVVELE